jgi:hypothetical protein
MWGAAVRRCARWRACRSSSADHHLAALARFFSDDSNRLASAGKDGQLFVWRIGEDEGPIFAQQLLSIRMAGVASAAGFGLRLAWVSTSEDLIAFSGGSTVYLASVSQAGVEGSQVGADVALQSHIKAVKISANHHPMGKCQHTSTRRLCT